MTNANEAPFLVHFYSTPIVWILLLKWQWVKMKENIILTRKWFGVNSVRMSLCPKWYWSGKYCNGLEWILCTQFVHFLTVRTMCTSNSGMLNVKGESDFILSALWWLEWRAVKLDAWKSRKNQHKIIDKQQSTRRKRDIFSEHKQPEIVLSYVKFTLGVKVRSLG